MKSTRLNLFAALLTMALSGCSSMSTGGIRIGETPALRIAKDASLPGKGVPGQCLPFAKALHHKFEAAGIPSRMIVYGYETFGTPLGSAGTTQPDALGSAPIVAGSHIVVAYEDQGRTYIMDNESWSPKWVHAGTPANMAQQTSGMDFKVKLAREVRDESTIPASNTVITGLRFAAQ